MITTTSSVRSLTRLPIPNRIVTKLSYTTILVPLLGLGLSSCGRNETSDQKASISAIAVIELLEHGQAGLTVADKVSVRRIGNDFKLAGTNLHLLEYWPHAEEVRETSNDNSEEVHAIEVQWQLGEGKAETAWIYQTDDEGPAGVLPETNVQVRLLQPGARPASSSQWESDPKGTVQFKRGGEFFSLVGEGQKPFLGWTVEKIRTLEHALLGEGGEVEETDDSSFINRVIEVTLKSTDGSVERHLCFIDHPKLTKGIHPTFLPVSRLVGNGASQSRLVACDLLEGQSAQHHRVLISPNASDAGNLTAFLWNHEDDTTDRIVIDSLPTEVSIGETSLRLLNHRDHARSVVKWQKQTLEGENSKSTPALHIMWLEGHKHEQAVLPLDRPTPVRINGEFKILCYRHV